MSLHQTLLCKREEGYNHQLHNILAYICFWPCVADKREFVSCSNLTALIMQFAPF